ncbi:uncharacterized protein A1O9_11358 [Exophiala aquamarina CBS 119918]|uniref:SP-RING-type domain-containing protein n=1 Tax=Exophiala aquamarina CBS 119918 TaxID=1182545 RepID=A0A072NY17_9EURO|nr:uncharacterized protein A1O9_11358 [Exophiala aquamarina CBS 119918]KEF52516.1 hypothetical protein A1O9_11358 [Exophiala aquamarina CBS 119918]
MSVASRRIRDSRSQHVSSPVPSATPFVPQALELPLSATAQTALSQLFQTHAKSTKLSDNLTLAIEQITQTTGDLNDVAYEKRIRYDKASSRRRANEEDSDQEERDVHTSFQSKVQELTKKMDLSIRSVIDDQIWLEDFPDAAKTVIAASEEPSSQHREQDNQSPTPIQPTQHTQAGQGEDRSRMGNSDGDPEHNAIDSLDTSHSNQRVTPHVVLQSRLQDQSRDWQSKSLTERYASNNEYRGWKRIWYDANNPGESAPPMPDGSLWFAAEEGREFEIASQRAPHAGEDGDSDSDLEIAAEKVRLKCPITLLPYQNPVTSANCNHSYERDAILDMLRTSSDHVPFNTEQLAEINQLRKQREKDRKRQELAAQQEKQVKCPECSVPLRKGDLKPNPALQRRVQRHLAAKERAEAATSDVDGSDEDGLDDVVRGTQRRPVGVGSSPPTSARRSFKSVKAEKRNSMVPQTQLSTSDTPRGIASRGRVLDIDAEDDDDDEDDDE